MEPHGSGASALAAGSLYAVAGGTIAPRRIENIVPLHAALEYMNVRCVVCRSRVQAVVVRCGGVAASGHRIGLLPRWTTHHPRRSPVAVSGMSAMSACRQC